MLQSCFNDLTDNRVAGRTNYNLEHTLLFVVFALLSNATSYRKIGIFMKERLGRLREVSGIDWPKAPAHNTIRDILIGLNSEELERGFRVYAERLQTGKENLRQGRQVKQIAFDRKALCGSTDPRIDKRFIQLLSGFLVEEKIILCHYEIDEKSNEIPALQTLIEELGLSGYLITADALHCQKKPLKPLGIQAMTY